MHYTFNTTAWLVQTGLVFTLMLITVPVARTILGIILLIFAKFFSKPNSALQRAGVKTLPKYVRALLGISIGISGIVSVPAYASDELMIDRISTYQTNSSHAPPQTIQPVNTYQVQRGDSLWTIASKLLQAQQTDPTAALIDSTWRSIWELNESIIGDNPSLITPGLILQIPAELQNHAI